MLDDFGDLYIADSQSAVIRKVDVSDAPALTFPNTQVGVASASQDIAVMNLGNMPLTLSAISAPTN